MVDNNKGSWCCVYELRFVFFNCYPCKKVLLMDVNLILRSMFYLWLLYRMFTCYFVSHVAGIIMLLFIISCYFVYHAAGIVMLVHHTVP